MSRSILRDGIIFILIVNIIFLFACTSSPNLNKGASDATGGAYSSYIKKHAPSDNAYVALQRLAERHIRDQDWERAASVFEKHKRYFSPSMEKRIEKTIKLLRSEGRDLTINNLGGGINTKTDEYLPCLRGDEKRLYFTSRYREDSPHSEDIYYSDFENGSWQRSHNLSDKINTRAHESINSVTLDGNKIIFFGNYKNSFGRGDIYFARRTKEGWSNISHYPKPINSEYFDVGGTMSSDGKALFFCSERPGGIGEFHKKGESYHGDHWGNTDIYVCIKTEYGWSKPINLGPQINTPYCEYSPFLHPDGKTLYFSSDGHYGLGRLYVYKVERLKEDSWKKWSEPVNLGKEINTAGNDWGYTISTSGSLAYFSASDKRAGFGGDDIYSITLPQEAKPEPVASISGKVTDSQGNPLAAKIKWELLSTGENVGELKSNPQNGKYFISLPLGKKYGYYAKKEGYYPVSKNVNLKGKKNEVRIKEDIQLTSTDEMREEGKTVEINNIFFDFNEHKLKPESHSELDRLAKFLKKNPEVNVEIQGYTDSFGSKQFNRNLSQKRAEAVVKYLQSKGCDPDKLIPTGYGEKKPVATNKTESGRAKNRRVEFKILRDDK